MKFYSKEEMISFGEYILKITNDVIKRNTNMKPLDSETGPKLIKDLFSNWESINETTRKENLDYIKNVLREWGGFKINEVEGESCPVFSQIEKDSCWLIETINSDGVEITHYVNEIEVNSNDVNWCDLGDVIIDELSTIVENYEADQIKTRKRIFNE